MRLKKCFVVAQCVCIYSEEEAIQLGEPVASKKQEKINNKKAVKSVQNESDDDEDEGNFPFYSLLCGESDFR